MAELNIKKLQELVGENLIKVLGFEYNKPACECYVHTIFMQSDGYHIETMVPYEYRRSHLALKNEFDIAQYLISIKSRFEKEFVTKWCADELSEIATKNTNYAKFLRILLSSGCNEILQNKFPQNNNPQKIFQAIKDNGYILSILRGSKENCNHTRYWLLPLPKIGETIYEKMSPVFRARVIRILEGFDAYEGKKTSVRALLPDHKFPEIRWTPDVVDENSDDMEADIIKAKFQLLTTQRNEHKREVCKKCKQTGQRGLIYGINFFYKGTEIWDITIPEVGREAEKGCIGCPWYDIQKWREELQKTIDIKRCINT